MKIAPVYAAYYGVLEYARSSTSGNRIATDLDDAHRASAGCMACARMSPGTPVTPPPPEVITCLAFLPGVIVSVVVLGLREIGDDDNFRVAVLGLRGIGNRSGTRVSHRYHPSSTIRARGRSRKLWRD